MLQLEFQNVRSNTGKVHYVVRRGDTDYTPLCNSKMNLGVYDWPTSGWQKTTAPVCCDPCLQKAVHLNRKFKKDQKVWILDSKGVPTKCTIVGYASNGLYDCRPFGPCSSPHLKISDNMFLNRCDCLNHVYEQLYEFKTILTKQISWASVSLNNAWLHMNDDTQVSKTEKSIKRIQDLIADFRLV